MNSQLNFRKYKDLLLYLYKNQNWKRFKMTVDQEVTSSVSVAKILNDDESISR